MPSATEEGGTSPVRHILADGRLESQAEAMQRLLSVVGLPETDLFRSKEELIAAACALQEERIAYTDEGMRQPVSRRSEPWTSRDA